MIITSFLQQNEDYEEKRQLKQNGIYVLFSNWLWDKNFDCFWNLGMSWFNKNLIFFQKFSLFIIFIKMFFPVKTIYKNFPLEFFIPKQSLNYSESIPVTVLTFPSNISIIPENVSFFTIFSHFEDFSTISGIFQKLQNCGLDLRWFLIRLKLISARKLCSSKHFDDSFSCFGHL